MSDGNAPQSVTTLPISVQSLQNSPDLANMTVGQVLGQSQRRISVTHVQSAAKLSTGASIPTQRPQIVHGGQQVVQVARPMSAGGITMAQVQQQPSTSVEATTHISRPVFQSYRFEESRTTSMPTRKLIVDQPDSYYRVDPSAPNQAIPVSGETVRNEQRMAYSSITADQIRQVAFPYAHSAPSQSSQSSHAVVSSSSDDVSTVTERQNNSNRNGVSTGKSLDRSTLEELVKQVDPTSTLEDSVKDALIDFVDDFVEQVIERSCKMSQHRGSSALEARDVEFILERYYQIPRIPRDVGTILGKGDLRGPEAPPARTGDLTAHNQRLALISKMLKKP